MEKIIEDYNKITKKDNEDSIIMIIRAINEKKSREISKLYSKFSENFSISNIISYNESFDKTNKVIKKYL